MAQVYQFYCPSKIISPAYAQWLFSKLFAGNFQCSGKIVNIEFS